MNLKIIFMENVSYVHVLSCISLGLHNFYTCMQVHYVVLTMWNDMYICWGNNVFQMASVAYGSSYTKTKVL
jgi:hypothetical protein